MSAIFEQPESDPDVLVIHGHSGFVDSGAERFVEDIQQRIANGLRKIIFDCGQMQHLTSVELGVLTRIHSRAAMLGGAVKLCGGSGLIPEILRVTHLRQVFDVQPDVAAALAAFRNFSPTYYRPGQ